jgi:hypothetical protein
VTGLRTWEYDGEALTQMLFTTSSFPPLGHGQVSICHNIQRLRSSRRRGSPFTRLARPGWLGGRGLPAPVLPESVQDLFNHYTGTVTMTVPKLTGCMPRSHIRWSSRRGAPGLWPRALAAAPANFRVTGRC